VREKRHGYSAYAVQGAIIGGWLGALYAYGAPLWPFSHNLERQASSLVRSWGRCSVRRCAMRGARPRSSTAPQLWTVPLFQGFAPVLTRAHTGG
jgi:hypothetical protein